MAKNTVYLKDYKEPVFVVDTVELDFALEEEHALVQSRLTLSRKTEGPMWLFGDELELISLELDGQALVAYQYELNAEGLLIKDCPQQFSLSITTKIYPQKNTKLSGLYWVNGLFCTQCEAEGFRRMTFFPDKPDVLSLYSTRISADKDKYPVLLSNGNLIAQGESANNRHWVVWQDPFKKPSYLFALVAGKLACVSEQFHTVMNRSVELRIYVEPGKENQCLHAMNSLKKAMKWDEEVYGREYDLDVFMIVAVSSFNMGAMENKGLNIFNDKYILVSPETATDQDYANVESVVAHEYFHNWTGNRVTCRDWFQLSLKEGLTVFRDQEFSRDMNSREVNRIFDVKGMLATQFPEDAGSLAHPVRPASYQEINNFYTATIYEKGAEVIRMQHTLLGAKGFRRGMDLYFERHDGQAVTIDDFVKAMEDANGVDFSQLKLWYSQAGTPELFVTESYQGGVLELTIRQSCRITPESKTKAPFQIPIRLALFLPDGEKVHLDKEVIELKEVEQVFRFERLALRPVVSLLRDFSAPVRVNFKQSKEDLLQLLRFETNGYSKWSAAQALALSCLYRWLEKPEPRVIDEVLLQSYRQILLDNGYDSSLRAELLSLPGFQEVIAPLKEVDVGLIESLREDYKNSFSTFLYESAAAVYETLWQGEEGALSHQAFSQRKLRNLCLFILMKAAEKESLTLCNNQFYQAKTMTDELAAFNLLANARNEEARAEAIDAFYQKWQHEPLVIQKWFAVQAMIEAPGALARVKQLMQHKDFSLKNPNKVRALIGSFTQMNHRHFHAIDGSGYRFLGELVLELDAINPQIAAGLAKPFANAKKYNKPRQQLMFEILAEMQRNKLSSDLDELVSKSLK